MAIQWDDVISDANESIRVHHASGHFTTEQAIARLVANGMTEDGAVFVLAQEVDSDLFDVYKTWPKQEV